MPARGCILVQFDHSGSAELSARGAVALRYAGRIPVEDASGCRFDVHEYRERRLLSRITTFRLDTGETVQMLDANTFVINATGEHLVRIRD